MNVSPYTDISLTSLLPRLEQESSTAGQEQTRSEFADFRQTLLAADTGLDTVELSSPQVAVEPTRSALFQSHLGAFGPGTPRMDGNALPEEQSPLRIAGISAAVAANPFAGDRSLASNPFQEALLGPASAQSVPSAAGAEDFSGIYDARTGQIIHRVGTRLDVKG